MQTVRTFHCKGLYHKYDPKYLSKIKEQAGSSVCLYNYARSYPKKLYHLNEALSRIV